MDIAIFIWLWSGIKAYIRVVYLEMLWRLRRWEERLSIIKGNNSLKNLVKEKKVTSEFCQTSPSSLSAISPVILSR